MGRYTAKKQGEEWLKGVHINDYIYITYGQEKLSFLVKITSDFKELPEEINTLIGSNEFVYREYEILYSPLIDQTKNLKNDQRSWLPSGYSTLKQITDITEANKILFTPYYGMKFKKDAHIFDKNLATNNNYNPSLNQIFYGPPGTGKTYNTILEAAKIITQDETINYDDAQKTFNNNLGAKIEFITFHQNYSYEDFIQGLRPDTEENGELSFFKSDGVFKRIADRALKNSKDADNPKEAKKEFITVFSAITSLLNEGEIEELEIKMKQTSFYITDVGEKSIVFRKNKGESLGELRSTVFKDAVSLLGLHKQI